MTEEIQENKKTIISFIVGLLIGGLLVLAFTGGEEPHSHDHVDSETDTNMEETGSLDEGEITEDTSNEPSLSTGEANIVVEDQPAGQSIELSTAVYPVDEGWIGVRQYEGEELGMILGVVRFSESQGRVPETIELLQSTTPGNTYAIVIFEEDGDFDFSLDGDVQLETVFDTFTAE